MGLFGWSWPPGCSGPLIDEALCEVCERSVDNCVCPECHICGEVGNPACYVHTDEICEFDLAGNHGLIISLEQIQSYMKAEMMLFEAVKRENAYFKQLEEEWKNEDIAL